MVQDAEGIADADLPLAQLAAHMRLSDDFETVPGQAARLRQRLRTAIVSIERRTDKLLLNREVVLSGAVEGGRETALTMGPITALVLAEVGTADGYVPMPGAELGGPDSAPEIQFGKTLSAGTDVRITLRAGWSGWADVPAPLAEAALTLAAALDSGEAPLVAELIATLVAPWRRMRLGGRC